MKNLILFALVSFMSVALFSSCDDTDPVTTPDNDIIELATENGFSSLAAALTKANLVDVLKGDGNFTVFAPTNEAFDNLLAVIGQSSINDVPADVLEQILLYHVVDATVLSSDITPGDVTTLEGTPVTLDTQNGITVNGVSVISPFDVEASNGVIHTVSEVLVPASVAQFVNTVLEPAYFSESFTTLIQAAVKADVVGVLLSTPNLTIFAPSNTAFQASGIDPAAIDTETLASVLTYHVVGAKVGSSEIPRQATTLNGAEAFFSLDGSGAFINGNTEIVLTDIESGSGVVHVIDAVLLPPAGNVVETAINLSSSGEFTSLIAALGRTSAEGTPDQDLIKVLSEGGPFTVFAPTNAAFQTLLDTNAEWTELGDIPLDLLISVLSYHVVPARAYDKDLSGAIDSNNELPTALGQNISLDLSNLTINSGTNIIGVNNHASNGVIHVIDAVLLPS